MSVHEITHPLVKHKLGLLRQQSLSTRSFRQLTAEVGSLLTYEATSDLELEDYQVDTWAFALYCFIDSFCSKNFSTSVTKPKSSSNSSRSSTFAVIV